MLASRRVATTADVRDARRVFHGERRDRRANRPDGRCGGAVRAHEDVGSGDVRIGEPLIQLSLGRVVAHDSGDGYGPRSFQHDS